MVSKAANGLHGTDKIFLKEKPSLAIVAIRRSPDEIYSRKVSKHIDCTYAHTVKMISNMADMGLVSSKKQGRKKILELTEKGERYADELLQLLGEDKSLEELQKGLEPT